VIEECINVDQDILQQVLIPTLNVSRTINGEVDVLEKNNQSTVFVTTAGYKNSFSYANLLQFIAQMTVDPKNTIVISSDWRLPVANGLLPKNFVQEMKANGSFNEMSFEREYERKPYSLNPVNCRDTLRAARATAWRETAGAKASRTARIGQPAAKRRNRIRTAKVQRLGFKP
jgi:hypothetical protein